MYSLAPTLDTNDEVHDEFYEQLQVTIESIKISDQLIVMADFNGILGNEKVPCVTGAHGTGIRNNSEQRLLEFCSPMICLSQTQVSDTI